MPEHPPASAGSRRQLRGELRWPLLRCRHAAVVSRGVERASRGHDRPVDGSRRQGARAGRWRDYRARMGFKPFYRAFCGAFSDFKVESSRSVVEGDRVAALCHVTGRHVGDALGGKATGRRSISGAPPSAASRRHDRRGLEHVRFPDDVSADRVGEVAGGGGVRTPLTIRTARPTIRTPPTWTRGFRL